MQNWQISLPQLARNVSLECYVKAYYFHNVVKKFLNSHSYFSHFIGTYNFVSIAIIITETLYNISENLVHTYFNTQLIVVLRCHKYLTHPNLKFLASMCICYLRVIGEWDSHNKQRRSFVYHSPHSSMVATGIQIPNVEAFGQLQPCFYVCKGEKNS